MRVLIVEDDAKIASFLRRGLEADGHLAQVAADGERGLAQCLSGRFDLVLLDLMLPKIHGLEVLRQLRLSDRNLPIIAITARGEVEDRVDGLDHGADDYLVKPFSFLELQARIRALFRRTQQPLQRTLNVGDLLLDRLERTAACGAQSTELSAREFQLLELLMRNPGEPQTRAMIADRVWGYQFDTGTNVIDVYVNYLRKKLKDLGLQPIRTLRGIGYVLAPERCVPETTA